MKVFLLAHQDDEIFFLPHIINSDKKLFIYLTNGVSSNSPNTILGKRTSEANFVFEKYLEALNSQVLWWGLENSISEGQLHKHVNRELVDSLKVKITSLGGNIDTFLTTTFEGAHQDHDAVAVITRKLDEIFQVGIIEISTYPQWISKIYSFKVLSPRLPMIQYPFNRIKVLIMATRMMVSYKTQLRTWLGLGPAMLNAFAFRKYGSSTPTPIGVSKSCFYEFRGRANQNEVLKSLMGLN